MNGEFRGLEALAARIHAGTYKKGSALRTSILCY
jgi:hypothetical protein